MDYDLEFLIQPGLSPTTGIHGVKIKDIPTNYNNYLAANGRTAADISKIACASGKISAQLSGVGYGFIQEIEIFIVDPNDNANNKVVFERYQVPQNTGLQLELIGRLVDAAPILAEETFEVWVEMRLRSDSPELIRTRLELEFHVQGE